MNVRLMSATLLLAGIALSTPASAHEDLLGTRFVDGAGDDTGDCDHNHDPCRTLSYALAQANVGDAIKLGAGTYDISGLEIHTLLGKQGLRGGYSAGDHFSLQDPDANPTRLTGVDPAMRNAFIAHGFIVVDANGEVLPQITSRKLFARSACQSGSAGGQYPCHNIDFLGHVPLTEFSTRPSSASNLWGFVDLDDNREYAVIGHRNGTTVFEVTNPEAPREVGTIAGNSSAWREVKLLQVANPMGGHNAYAYMSTEAPGGGLQIIDLSNLPTSISLANTIRDIDTSHTLYISNVNYSTNAPLPGAQPFLYVAGANVSGGALRIYDLTNPAVPVLVTPSPAGAGYMHDSASMLITDNRTTQCANAHNPCEVMLDFNETSIEVRDVTDKAAPVLLSTITYPTASYVHSGWPTADARYVIVHDELDELRRGINTQMYTIDLNDLRAPSIVTSYVGPTTTTDHNGYTLGERYFVAHYKRGLVIFNSSNPRALGEVAYFDTYLSPSANTAGTDGVWGVYPFLPSGTLLVSDIENGLFLLARNETLPPPSGPPVTTPPGSNPPPPRAGGGSGGGRMDFALLILLAGFAMLRAAKTRH
jgi:choice-of-anchor B domain-containing protein